MYLLSENLPQDSKHTLPDYAFSMQIFIGHQLSASITLTWRLSHEQHHLRQAGRPRGTEMQMQGEKGAWSFMG